MFGRRPPQPTSAEHKSLEQIMQMHVSVVPLPALVGIVGAFACLAVAWLFIV